MKIALKAKVFPAHERVGFMWKAVLFLRLIGLGELSLKNLPSSMSVWQMLAAGLALWLTRSPKYSGEEKDGFPLAQKASIIL